jgi:hexosaminidase
MISGRTLMNIPALLMAMTLSATAAVYGQPSTLHLMPVPRNVTPDTGTMTLDNGFAILFEKDVEPRLERAAARVLDRISRETGITFIPHTDQPPPGALRVLCEAPSGITQEAVEDESYKLAVTPGGARLTAATPYGILRGLETFWQLVEAGPDGFHVPCVHIEDGARFPWRGVLIDVCRHWIPIEVIKRNLDAMAAVKLNVLHWHLSEDQGFRVESKAFPKLHELGSDGRYFTQAQIREVVAYAADRGIRVVPEFDMPGHTTAWLVAYPELASAPGPYTIERRWGVMDPTMDPTREEIYRFLDTFIGEMTGLFPDAFFHIGGDEVSGKHWETSPAIAAFKKTHGMKSNHDLQVYFNTRLLGILKKYNKTMLGWDEILHPELPKDIVVHSWRGRKSLAEAAGNGYRGILSSGYYLDHMQPASFHYAMDPLDKEVAALSDDAKKLILGGEACMWAEWVTPTNIDSRIWPRVAAVAERLWSPATVNDPADMYRRLDRLSYRLPWTGILHRSGYRSMLERIAGGKDIDALWTLAAVLEPMKHYTRHRVQEVTSLTPLNRLSDAVLPESDAGRTCAQLVGSLTANPPDRTAIPALEEMLGRLQDNHKRLAPLFPGNFLLREVEPVSAKVSGLAAVGLRALEARKAGERFTPTVEDDELLERSAKPEAEVHIMILEPVKKLIEATR